jgi:hypothetical protein
MELVNVPPRYQAAIKQVVEALQAKLSENLYSWRWFRARRFKPLLLSGTRISRRRKNWPAS